LVGQIFCHPILILVFFIERRCYNAPTNSYIFISIPVTDADEAFCTTPLLNGCSHALFRFIVVNVDVRKAPNQTLELGVIQLFMQNKPLA
jgi:hypothetical protein